MKRRGWKKVSHVKRNQKKDGVANTHIISKKKKEFQIKIVKRNKEEHHIFNVVMIK